jgi:hypothetical protein
LRASTTFHAFAKVNPIALAPLHERLARIEGRSRRLRRGARITDTPMTEKRRALVVIQSRPAVEQAFRLGHRLGRKWTDELVNKFRERLRQEVEAERAAVDARIARARAQHQRELEDIRREFREARAELGLARDPDATLH